jgi:predicted XRE-type DNA-binding protein
MLSLNYHHTVTPSQRYPHLFYYRKPYEQNSRCPLLCKQFSYIVIPMNWKTQIYSIQAKHGLSQQQIARYCGCSQATISDLVNGVIKVPNFEIGTYLVDLEKASRAKIREFFAE